MDLPLHTVKSLPVKSSFEHPMSTSSSHDAICQALRKRWSRSARHDWCDGQCGNSSLQARTWQVSGQVNYTAFQVAECQNGL